MKWFYLQDGTEYGPVSAAQLQRLVIEGRISPTDLVRSEKMQVAKPATSVKGLVTEDLKNQIPQTVSAADGSSFLPWMVFNTVFTMVATAALIICAYITWQSREQKDDVQPERDFIAQSSTEAAEDTEYVMDASTQLRLALASIDEIAAHPDDPDNPNELIGKTDAELQETSLTEVAELLELCIPFAREEGQPPRYLFALGRAALHHGMTELAHELLSEAAKKGSTAATAHLAFLTDDPIEAKRHLSIAVEKGFLPATKWLEEVTDSRISASPLANKIHYADFKQPKIIRALQVKDFSTLRDDPVRTTIYLINFVDRFMDQELDDVIRGEHVLKLRNLQDPRLKTSAKAFFVSNPHILEQPGYGTIGSRSKSDADPRASGIPATDVLGGIPDRTPNVFKQHQVTAEEGKSDAVTLALALESSSREAKLIVSGIIEFFEVSTAQPLDGMPQTSKRSSSQPE